MNYTFGRVAAHCGLRLSYYFTAGMLALAFLGLILTGYVTPSPLYILLTLAVLPSILKSMLFSNNKKSKRENDIAFPLFCKKYHYDYISYKAMNLAYLLLFILFAAWQFSYSLHDTVPNTATSLPAIIAGASLLTRILAVLGYRMYFYLFPLKAMR